MSGYLTGAAKPGDTIKLAGPIGSFYLRDVARPVLMLAGGTGLAPFLAMLDKLVAAGGSAHPVHLIYGVNTDADVVELERLDAFKAALPELQLRRVRGRRRQQLAEERLRHRPHRAGPPATRARLTSTCAAPRPWSRPSPTTCASARSNPHSFHYEKFAASV